jgi:hypothetical protein
MVNRRKPRFDMVNARFPADFQSASMTPATQR